MVHVGEVALASLYLGKDVHNRMALTGEATIHGKLGLIFGVREKTMAGLKQFPNETFNMIIPADNTVGSAIWTDYDLADPDHDEAHPTFERHWFKLEREQQSRLNVFAAKTLYEVLELALTPIEGKISCRRYAWSHSLLPACLYNRWANVLIMFQDRRSHLQTFLG